VTGPLSDLRVVELAGLGPAPFGTMLLADLGAQVIRVDRIAPDRRRRDPASDVMGRNRRSIMVDLKSADGVAVVLDLVEQADVLVEGFRPGVVERLGLGPAECAKRNPRLVYGRMTGWGQHGPYAQTAGHDITYVATTGALHAIGGRERPVPPLNLLGDFGGGGAYLAFGLLVALHEARTTGHGQVVDAAIVDGVSSLMAIVRGLQAVGEWVDERESNMLDGAAPYYGVYECADGEHVAIGAVEPQFWRTLLAAIGGSEDAVLAQRDDRAQWPAVRARLAQIFRSQSRDHWVDRCAGTDACLAPILSLEESLGDVHNRERGAFVDVDGVVQPAPAPRFGRSEVSSPVRAPRAGEHTREILGELGLTPARVDDLLKIGAVRECPVAGGPAVL
jgi:alpha-methylacyl-CoA racemase